MESHYVSAKAEGVIAAKVAELAAEFKATGVVNIFHVSLHVGLVHAFVRAEGTGELGVARIPFAA